MHLRVTCIPVASAPSTAQDIVVAMCSEGLNEEAFVEGSSVSEAEHWELSFILRVNRWYGGSGTK